MRAPPVSSSLLGVPGPAWGGGCVFLSLLFLMLWPSRVKAARNGAPAAFGTRAGRGRGHGKGREEALSYRKGSQA